MSHPDSAGLRQLADWLDKHGQHLLNVGAYAWLADSAGPKVLAEVVAAAGAVEYRSMDLYHPTAHCVDLGLNIHFDRDRCLSKRIVVREVEEFVIGDAA